VPSYIESPRPGPTFPQIGAALLVDPGARADPPPDEDVAAANGRGGQRARVAVDDDDAGHHVLAGGPADAARDVDLGAVDQAAAEVAEAAAERDAAAREDADPERVLRAGVLHGHVLDALLVEESAQLEVDQPGGEVLRVEGRLAVLDLGGARRLGEGLREPARVVRDPALAYRCHTITSPSYGS